LVATPQYDIRLGWDDQVGTNGKRVNDAIGHGPTLEIDGLRRFGIVHLEPLASGIFGSCRVVHDFGDNRLEQWRYWCLGGRWFRIRRFIAVIGLARRALVAETKACRGQAPIGTDTVIERHALECHARTGYQRKGVAAPIHRVDPSTRRIGQDELIAPSQRHFARRKDVMGNDAAIDKGLVAIPQDGIAFGWNDEIGLNRYRFLDVIGRNGPILEVDGALTRIVHFKPLAALIG
jgi:hypothetical protein